MNTPTNPEEVKAEKPTTDELKELIDHWKSICEPNDEDPFYMQEAITTGNKLCDRLSEQQQKIEKATTVLKTWKRNYVPDVIREALEELEK